MPFTPLLSTSDLASHLFDPNWILVDCCFDLAETTKGERLYREAHIPGAVYAHLDRDLSGSKTGTNGRHPLPDMEAFKARLGHWGIRAGVQVVVYDQDNGMYASRLWWMLRYLGHTAVAVLDGGMAKWTSERRPVRAGDEQHQPTTFEGSPHFEMLLSLDEVERLRLDSAHILIDARAPERYRGDVEPLDPVAGHIPGAINDFYKNNVQPDGTFLDPATLRNRLQNLLGNRPPQNAAVYCGSGVTACHTLLALEHAGLSGAKLYAGSWSEWCADPERAKARG
jgi:thiosulfate/3-mercaptopyruvate sulfurtransferase